MGALDGPLANVAQTLLGKFGRGATLRRPGTPGTYDPTTGGYTGGSAPTSVPCNVVFSEFGVGQIDGTLVKLGDRKALVARADLTEEPVPDRDTLVVNSKVWAIKRVLGYSTGEYEAAYELHVRA